MSKISQSTIQFIRNAIESPNDALILAGLHTLEDVTNSPRSIMHILNLPCPFSFGQWNLQFRQYTRSNQKFVWLWVLGRFAEIGVEWAMELRELTLAGHSLYTLPYNIGSLCKVELLDLSQNSLDDLPKSINSMRRLKKLYIHDNEFSYIPDWVEDLELDLLYAVGNPLRQIPKGVQAFAMDDDLWGRLHDNLDRLTGLKSMLFQGIPFPCDHRWMEKQKQLQRMSFADCLLWTLPSGLMHCTKLEHLSVTDSDIFTLGDEVAFFPILKSLHLEFVSIKRLPKGLENCRELQSVSVVDAEMSRFPSCLQRLRELESIDFCGNSIHRIPKWIGKLKKLKSISFRNNELSDLPASFERLTSLYTLDLSGNLLARVPDALYQLPQLRRLILTDNNLSVSDVFKLQAALPDCVIQF